MFFAHARTRSFRWVTARYTTESATGIWCNLRDSISKMWSRDNILGVSLDKNNTVGEPWTRRDYEMIRVQ